MIPLVKRAGTAQLLFNSAQALGLDPAWVTPGGLFVVSTSQGERYINRQRSSLNTAVSISLASNKYHTRLILARHGLPNIPFARPASYEDAAAFLAKHGTIVVKPLRGYGSKGVHIVRTTEQLATLKLKGCIIEKYAPGKEVRYLILNGAVIGVCESKYGTAVDVHRSLECETYEATAWNDQLVAMSLKISSILGLAFAAVDYLIDADGQPHILEVNTCPDLQWFHAPSAGPTVDVATLFLEAMVSDVEATVSPTAAVLLGA